MYANKSNNHDSGSTDRQLLETRLSEAGVLDMSSMAVSVEDGEKVCYDHDDRCAPSEVDGNWGLYLDVSDRVVILDVDEYDDDELPEGVRDLPETFTELSPHGGKHLIYVVELSEGRFPAAVFEEEVGVKNPIASWGEVLAANKYSVAAGSYLDDCGKDWHDCSEPGEGSYEVLHDRPVAVVSADEMLDALLADSEVEKVSRKVETDGGSGGKTKPKENHEGVDLDGLKVDEVVDGYDEGERDEHPCHGSKTGSNFMVDDGGETWRCWRHDCTGNALHLIGLQEDIIGCGEWVDDDVAGSALSSETWEEILDAAASRGIEIPDKTSAVLSVDDDDPAVKKRLINDVAVPYLTDGNPMGRAGAADRMAEVLNDEMEFIYPADSLQWPTELHWWNPDTGLWEESGEREALDTLREHVGSIFRLHLLKDAVELLTHVAEVDRHEVREREPEDHRLLCGNGVLDLKRAEVEEPDPEELHSRIIPVEYNPDAECPKFDEFVDEVVDDGSEDTIYRMIASCLYAGVPDDKAFMLVGDGSNGKGTVMDVIRGLIGWRNTKDISLEEIVNDRFTVAELRDTLVNMNGELEAGELKNIRSFKQFTGDGRVSASRKHEQQKTEFKPISTLIFAANEVPEMPRDQMSVWRRWNYIRFPKTFSEDEKDPNLSERLTEMDELEGILCRAVDEAREALDPETDRGWYPDSRSPNRTRYQMRRAANPVFAFAGDMLEEKSSSVLRKDHVHAVYQKYADENELPAMNLNIFGRELLGLDGYSIGASESRVYGDDSEKETVYTGVAWSDEAKEDYVPDSVLVDDDDDDDEDDGENGTGQKSVMDDPSEYETDGGTNDEDVDVVEPSEDEMEGELGPSPNRRDVVQIVDQYDCSDYLEAAERVAAQYDVDTDGAEDVVQEAITAEDVYMHDGKMRHFYGDSGVE